MRPDAVSRAIVDGLGAIVWEARPDREPGLAHFSFVSDGTEAMLGYPPGAWTGDPRFWLDITHADDRERVVSAILHAARVSGRADFEFRATHADGRTVWLRNIVRVDRDEQPAPRMSGVVVEITARKLAEERLARVHAVSMRLSSLMDATEVARTVVQEGRAAVGATAAALYALEGDTLRSVAAEGYPPEARDEMAVIALDARAPAAQVVRTRLPIWIGTAQEADDHYPDRPAKDVGRGASCALPLVAEDRVLGAMAVRMPDERPFATADRVLLDVLANAAAQALLLSQALSVEQAARAGAERATALLETIIEKAPEGWALFDTDLRYLRVNEALARINGVPAGDHVGRTLEEIVPEIPGAGHREPLERVLETGEAVELEVRGRTAADPHRDHVWLVSYYPVRGAGEEIEALGALVTDITERRVAEDRAALLAALGPILDEVVGVEQRLERLARALAGTLGDHCTVTLEEGGAPERVAIAHVDRDGERALALLPPTDLSGLDGTLVVEAAEDDVLRRFATDEAHLRLMQRVGTASGVVVPLAVRGRRIGHLAVGSARPRAFGPQEVALIEEVGRRAAIAVDNARLYESERLARERTARLQTITAALSEALTPGDVAASILDEALPAVGAHMGSVWQVGDDGTAIVPLGQSGYPDPTMEGWRHLPLSQPLPMTDAMRDGRLRWLPSMEAKLAAWPHLAEAFRAAGDGSLVILPLLARGVAVGCISLSFPRRDALAEEDLAFLESLASQCAQALERARLYEAERRVAVTLQRSLLPARLPAVEGLEIAVRYLPAAGLEAGGDFYEALRLPGGAIGVAVGDVVGRGAQAAASMGQLRSALRAFAMAGDGPATVLRRLSAYAETVEGALAATAAYVVVDPEAGELRYACAGHPYPVLAQPAGRARFLRGGRSVPLACLADPAYPEAVERLEPGDTLLLFTDGLTERRGVDADVAMERLRASLEGISAHALPALLDAVVSGQGAAAPMDDVALLAVRVAGAVHPPRHLRAPARHDTMAATRSEVRAWLADAGVPPAVASDVLLATGEAVANAVEHAYLDAPGDLEVTLRTAGEVEVEVRDHGRWRAEGGAPDRGRGFMLMRALMTDVQVERGAGGTTVRMRRTLAEPPAGSPPDPGRVPDPARVEVARPGRAALHGDLDLASAADVAEALAAAVDGGTLEVDLGGLGYLDSVGAQALVELSRRADVRLLAPEGSVARRTLELAGLDAALGL